MILAGFRLRWPLIVGRNIYSDIPDGCGGGGRGGPAHACAGRPGAADARRGRAPRTGQAGAAQ